MFESSKAMKRRYNDGAFHTRFFVGNGIDVVVGPDCISRYQQDFALMKDVRNWDKPNGDAQELPGIEEASFDFLHSSHCLEHLNQPFKALTRWIKVVKPGGHLIITVPDEELYEHNTWPSQYGEGHIWSFRLTRKSVIEGHHNSIEVLELLRSLNNLATVERLTIVRDFYNPNLGKTDQTLLPNAECAIEFILKRRT